MAIYKRAGNTLTRLTISANPSDAVYDLTFNSDGDWLYCVGAGGYNVYRKDYTTFTHVTGVLPSFPGASYNLALAPDNLNIAFSSNVSPYVSIYTITSDTAQTFVTPVHTETASNLKAYIKT